MSQLLDIAIQIPSFRPAMGLSMRLPFGFMDREQRESVGYE
jgi:hypothetical protein